MGLHHHISTESIHLDHCILNPNKESSFLGAELDRVGLADSVSGLRRLNYLPQIQEWS